MSSAHPFAHIRTWIFDLDDTLYPPETGLLADVKDRFKKHVIEHYGWSEKRLDKVAAEIVASGSVDPFAEIKRQLPFDNQRWGEYVSSTTRYELLDKCYETIKLIQALPGKKVIFTNGGRHHAEKALATLGLRESMDHISDSLARNMRVKPEPEIYLELQAEVEANPAQTLMVDDAYKCLKPAKELGWSTVLVHQPELPAEIDYVDHTFDRFKDFLKVAAGPQQGA